MLRLSTFNLTKQSLLVSALCFGCSSDRHPVGEGHVLASTDDGGVSFNTGTNEGVNTSGAVGDSDGSGASDDATGADAPASSTGNFGDSDNGAANGTGEPGGEVSSGGAEDLPPFSFFVTSAKAIFDLAGSRNGFGGDLRYGEAGPGAGLRGADKICAEIAERSMPGASSKQWRAFLSASTGGPDGGPVHARDRIGNGPWYDRLGRVVGESLDDLIGEARPSAADPEIKNDLPNEDGVPNHDPDGTGAIDNHDTLTGSDAMGRYVPGSNTCEDWTSAPSPVGRSDGNGPMIGHTWPRFSAGSGGDPLGEVLGDLFGSFGAQWISDHRAGGCGAEINLGGGSTNGRSSVGSGGGYGGFYCFALVP